MTIEQIRQDLVTAISARKASFTGGYPLLIEYDNIEEFDSQTQVNPYLRVDIKLVDMEQSDISDNPTHRVWGQLILGAGVKEGGGTKPANTILMHFYPHLQRKRHGIVTTKMATVAPVVSHLGWLYTPILIPFWGDLKYSV